MQNYLSLLFDFIHNRQSSLYQAVQTLSYDLYPGVSWAMQCFEYCYYLLLSFHLSCFAVVSGRSLYYWYMIRERTVIIGRL